jgi:hypothetical protein
MYCWTMRWVLKKEPLMAMACCMIWMYCRGFVKHRENSVFQLPVERFGFFGAVRRNIIRVNGAARFADRPSGYTFDVPFRPPPVKNAQAWDSVEGGFHAAGAGSLERKLRRVEPKVDAGCYFSAEIEIVLVEENHGNGFPQSLFRMENMPDDVLAAGVVGVRFAGINNLKMSCVFGYLAQAVQVRKNQVRAFVTSRTACKPNREGFLVQCEASFLTHGLKKVVLGDKMRGPHFFGGKAEAL